MNRDKIKNDLLAFSLGIINGENGTKLIESYNDSIDKLIPSDVISLVDRLVLMPVPIDDIKKNIGKILNVFYKPLNEYKWDHPEEGFLYFLMLENEALGKRMNLIKEKIKSWNKLEFFDSAFKLESSLLKEMILDLQNFNNHYIKKENILFPYLEKKLKDYRCLQVMWSFHDDIRKSIKKLSNLFDESEISVKKINQESGKLFFLIFAIKFREDFILYPVIADIVDSNDWMEMHNQSFEIGFSYIDLPEKYLLDSSNMNVKDDMIDLGTGIVNLSQLKLMLDTIPVDVTLVDYDDKVTYFSGEKDRIFPRSKAVIGRDVHNCHPPESVDRVEKIIESFRSGERDKESFWIEMKGKFILIEYFALRDEKGKYMGTLEASQDITEIKKLTGEKRL